MSDIRVTIYNPEALHEAISVLSEPGLYILAPSAAGRKTYNPTSLPMQCICDALPLLVLMALANAPTFQLAYKLKACRIDYTAKGTTFA